MLHHAKRKRILQRGRKNKTGTRKKKIWVELKNEREPWRESWNKSTWESPESSDRASRFSDNTNESPRGTEPRGSRERKHLECTSTKPSVRDGTDRTGPGRAGPGRTGGGARDRQTLWSAMTGTWRVCKIVGLNRTLKVWSPNLRHEEENPPPPPSGGLSSDTDTLLLFSISAVMWLCWWGSLDAPRSCDLNPDPCSFWNIDSLNGFCLIFCRLQ